MRDPVLAFMARALALAKKGVGRTSPNPAVGAVVVKNGVIIGEGYHRRAGGPHAEIEALRALSKRRLKGAELYVTLEPCCHFGRTPPCTDAILSSGIKKVFIGMKDPNPRVSGRGIRILRKAGIEAVSGMLEDECHAINAPYIKHITTGLPFVTLKLASTLDGRCATSKGESRWITGKASRTVVHRMRSVNDAVLVGSNTIIKDDPELNVRLAAKRGGKDPLKAVLDSGFKTPPGAKVFKNGNLIIFTTDSANPSKIKKARQLGAEVVVLGKSHDGVDINSALRELGKRQVVSVLAEAGSRLASSLLKAGAVDRFVVFLAPFVLGSDSMPSIGALGMKRLVNAKRLTITSCTRTGEDIMIEGSFR